jgi:hypothetical protein
MRINREALRLATAKGFDENPKRKALGLTFESYPPEVQQLALDQVEVAIREYVRLTVEAKKVPKR